MMTSITMMVMMMMMMMVVRGDQVKVDEFIETVSTTVETYARLFSDGDMTTFNSDDEAHFLLALTGVITSTSVCDCPSVYTACPEKIAYYNFCR